MSLEDKRLVFASIPILVLFLSFFVVQNRALFGLVQDIFLGQKQLEQNTKRSRIYPVLLKDKEKIEKQTQEIPALSDF